MTRNPALDGLRGIAALLVVGQHTAALDDGAIGVDLFFVLSGFVITSLLLDEKGMRGSVDFARFYAQRSLRLIPPLFLMLGAYLAISPYVWPREDALMSSLLAATYLTDLIPSELIPRRIGHTWSLSVEMHFYLIWPFLIIALGRLRWSTQTAGLLLVYVIGVIWRTTQITDHPYSLDLRFPGLILGSAVGVITHHGYRLSERGAAALAIFCVPPLVGIALRDPGWSTAILSTEIIAAGLILALHSSTNGAVGQVLSSGPVVFTGTISYSIYLWHWPISELGAREHWWGFPAVLAASYAIAAASWFAIEKPLMRLRSRLREHATATHPLSP